MFKVPVFHTTSEEHSADRRSVYHDNTSAATAPRSSRSIAFPGPAVTLAATDAVTSPKPNTDWPRRSTLNVQRHDGDKPRVT